MGERRQDRRRRRTRCEHHLAAATEDRRRASSDGGRRQAGALSIEEGSAVIQQGQVFKLQASCADGEPLRAYRYRVAGAVRRGCRWAGSAARLRRRGRSRSSLADPARWPSGEFDARRVGRGVLDGSWLRSRSSAGCSGRRPPAWVRCALPSSRRSRSARGGRPCRKGTASRRPRRSGRC